MWIMPSYKETFMKRYICRYLQVFIERGSQVEALVKSSFVQSQLENSLLIRKVGQKIAMVLVYFNDLLITRNDHNPLYKIKHTLITPSR